MLRDGSRENLKAVVANWPAPEWKSFSSNLLPPAPLSGCRNCYLCSCRRDIDWPSTRRISIATI